MSKIYGTFSWSNIPGLIFRESRIVTTPQYGVQYEYVYEGSPQAILAAYNQVAADQIKVLHQRDDGALWGLTVSTADDPSGAQSSVVANTFELVGDSVQKDIREHPVALALGYEVMQKIDALLRRDSAEVTNDVINDTLLVHGNNAVNLYKDMRQRDGSMAYQESQFVFRVTTIISKRNNAIQIGYANVNKLFTTDQLISETNPPSDYVLSLVQLEEQTSLIATPGGQYLLSWLKGTPTVTEAPGNRTAIQVEYSFDQWSTRYYALKA